MISKRYEWHKILKISSDQVCENSAVEQIILFLDEYCTFNNKTETGKFLGTKKYKLLDRLNIAIIKINLIIFIRQNLNVFVHERHWNLGIKTYIQYVHSSCFKLINHKLIEQKDAVYFFLIIKLQMIYDLQL